MLVTQIDDNFICPVHNSIGVMRFGFPDFTAHPNPLVTAGGGSFDLVKDEFECERMLISFPKNSFQDYRDSTQLPAMRGKSIRTIFIRGFHAHYAKVEREAGNRHGSAMLSKVEAHLNNRRKSLPPHGLALEAAGGHGRFIEGFRRRFDGVVFVDCSLQNLVLARQLATEAKLSNITFVRADVTRLPFANNTFAFIHENNVIEHVSNPISMVSEAWRLLSPGGVYAMLSPNAYPITPEPHFGIPLFAAIPKQIRTQLIRITRGNESEEGTRLQSLYGIRKIFRNLEIDVEIFFLPPSLLSLARTTKLRKLIQFLLGNKITSAVILSIVNGPLLAIMPYHLSLAQKPEHLDVL